METDDGTTCIDKIMRKIDWKMLKDIKLPIGKCFKRLDWYIIKKFLGTYVFAIALIISIAVVFDFNEKMYCFMSHEAPWQAIIFDYYMNFIPYFANLFSPLFVFIAVIFFTSKLAENSEIIAMFSTGMSFKRMLRPYMVSAAIIAITTFCSVRMSFLKAALRGLILRTNTISPVSPPQPAIFSWRSIRESLPI